MSTKPKRNALPPIVGTGSVSIEVEKNKTELPITITANHTPFNQATLDIDSSNHNDSKQALV